jgi:hypothetical protein
MSIDHLPTEFPKECTEAVGDVMCPYFEKLFKQTNALAPFDDDNLPHEWVKSIIVDKGRLAKRYAYLNRFIKE